jgi:hypothetical protein
MTEIIEKWIKRNNRKKPKLVRSEGISHYIVYFDKGKARVGIVQDGMYTRYGIICYGAMPNTDPFHCWQSEPGACDENDVKVMVDYLNGASQLPDFDFASLKEVRA